MEAVYTLCNVDRGVPEVWGSVYDIRDLLLCNEQAARRQEAGRVPAPEHHADPRPAQGPLTNNVVADLLKKYNIV